MRPAMIEAHRILDDRRVEVVDLLDPLQQPFIVMDPDHPNYAAKIEGRYCLLVVSFKSGQKQIQRAWSEKLAGP